MERGALQKKDYPNANASISTSYDIPVLIDNHGDACPSTIAIIRNAQCDYHPLCSNYFQASKRSRYDIYNHYNVFFLNNTEKSARWLVCNCVCQYRVFLNKEVSDYFVLVEPRSCTVTLRLLSLRPNQKHSTNVHSTRNICLRKQLQGLPLFTSFHWSFITKTLHSNRYINDKVFAVTSYI